MRKQLEWLGCAALGGCLVMGGQMLVKSVEGPYPDTQIILEVRDAHLAHGSRRMADDRPFGSGDPFDDRDGPEMPFEKELVGSAGPGVPEAAAPMQQALQVCGTDTQRNTAPSWLKLSAGLINRSAGPMTFRPIAVLRLQDGQGRVADLKLRTARGAPYSAAALERPERISAEVGTSITAEFEAGLVCARPALDRELVANLLAGTGQATLFLIDDAGRVFASAPYRADSNVAVPMSDSEAFQRLQEAANGAGARHGADWLRRLWR